jgi:H+-transporting ATPase
MRRGEISATRRIATFIFAVLAGSAVARFLLGALAAPMSAPYAVDVRETVGLDATEATGAGTAKPWRELVAALKTNIDRGLSRTEVERRQRAYGPNATPEVRKSPLARLLRRFTGLTAWMLEGTAVLAYLLGKRADAIVVAVLLVVNAVLGFVQEERASRSVEALKRRLHVNARVLRGGAWASVAGPALVPGDVVRIRGGDIVPADLKLVRGSIEIDESALTGESMARRRGEDDAVYSGSIVRRGEATGVVVATGTRTLFGRTAELVQIAAPRLHAEALIARLARVLLALVAGLLLIAVVVGAARGGSLAQLLPLLLVMLVSAVPVALPAMFTVTMALGSTELSRRGALVTHLRASEDAARMDVLCVDKTGTLTENRLLVAEVVPAPGCDEEEVLRWAAWGAEQANQDPIDEALLRAARERGLSTEAIERVSFVPFDPATRRTEATVRRTGEMFRVMKGAVAVVAAECSAVGVDDLAARAASLAGCGYRTLAVARAEGDGAYAMLGLVALHDRPRADAPRLIRELSNLGVTVKMLTGDSLPVAREVAASVGLEGDVTSAVEFRRAAAASPARAGEIAEETSGFGEIYPEDKYLVVTTLQARGHVVGMTGDGVNDAPALRQAEVGIAVENGTDVAKGAASVVLTTQDLAAILDLVRVGRSIHQRVETWIVNKVVKTFQTVVLLVTMFLITGRFMVSTFGMVLLLFLVDFVTLSLATDAGPGAERPATWNIGHLARTGVVLGLLAVVESLGLVWLAWRPFALGSDGELFHTFGFELLFFFGLFTVFAVRTRERFWRSRPSRTLVLVSVVDAVLVVMFATFGLPGLAPAPPALTAMVIVYAALFALVVNDGVKVALLRLPHDA